MSWRHDERPVGADVPGVGAPAERVAEAELLLVHPIGGAVDDGLTAIGRELLLSAARDVGDEDVVVADEPDLPAVGGDLRGPTRAQIKPSKPAAVEKQKASAAAKP